MTVTVTARRRLLRWAVAVWLVLIALAGGLTLWLQDSTEPQRYGWEDSAPTPSLGEQGRTECADVAPDEDGQAHCLSRGR